MAQYIPKDALVAEIEMLKADALQKKSQCKRSGLERIMHQIGAYNKILSLIYTLEVKEVDLDKAIDDYIYTHDGRKRLALELDWKCCNLTLKGGDGIIKFAKHFFELGLKAQKGEEV
jgi:hypothetical protein